MMDIDIYDDFNVNDLCSYIMLLEQLVANERPEGDSNPGLCNAGTVLYQLRYLAN